MSNETTLDDVLAHDVHAFPKDDTYWRHSDLEALDEYDLKELSEGGIAECWYWYASGSYEGSGNLIGRDKGGKWLSLDLGHCSCYGPIEDVARAERFASIADLKAAISSDLADECAHLFAAIDAAQEVGRD